MISVSGVSMRFGSKVLFEDVTTTFSSGRRYGLTGPNGAGKSTFMKLLTGELDPQQGTVVLPAKLGVLRQDQYAFDGFRVSDTVVMGNRRLWDAGASYAHAQPTLQWQTHMTYAAFALGVSQSFYYPAYSAFLPRILPPDQLLAANGLEGAVRPTFAQALGPALGGIIVGAFMPAAGAAVIAAAYGIALVLLVFVRPEPPLEHPDGVEPEKPGFWHDLADGVRFTVKTPWLLWTLLFAALLLLVIMGPIEVLIPLITDQRFENSEQAYGFLLASFGIGGAIGSLAVSSWRLPRRYLTIMMLAWGVGCLPLAIFGFVDAFWVMAGALAIVGFTFSAGSVIWGTLLQRRVPLTMLGRVSSLDFFVSISLMPVSIAIVGPIATVVPIPVIFLVAGLLPPLLALGGILAGRMWRDEIANPLDTTDER